MKQIFKQAWRFLLVGLLNAGVGYTFYIIMLQFNLAPGLALAIATFLGALFNYFTTGRIVFNHASWNRVIHFILAYVVIYLLNWGALEYLISLQLSPELAQAMLLPAYAALSFVIFKFLIFRSQNVIDS